MKISNDQPFEPKGLEKTGKLTQKDDISRVSDMEKAQTADRVNISERAKMFEEMKKEIEYLPDVRQDKIETLK